MGDGEPLKREIFERGPDDGANAAFERGVMGACGSVKAHDAIGLGKIVEVMLPLGLGERRAFLLDGAEVFRFAHE